ncbi:MAG TPA: primosomal protein N' [Candidatus Alistipes stercoravium]|nr:primosomal protein N' [Candidatus Alistipes stercoravium]
MPRYADIVLPLAQPAYTFALPEGMTVVAGQAVVVQFGARKFYTGIVFGVHDRQPASPRIKSVVRVLYDGTVLLPAAQRTLWEWIASYYMCTVGEVMRAALPALMKPSADSEQALSEEEFRPRTEVYLRLAAELHDEARFHETCERLERRAPKQYAALLEIATAEGDAHLSTGEIARRLLGADYGVLHALERKGLIRSAEHPRTQERADTLFRLPCLSEAQQRALATLRDAFAAGRTAALLHGITGSGKTEIYIHLIAGALARGEDVLLLVPEIALTAQLIERLERIFGSRVTAYHSKLTPRRRTEVCLRLARSSGGELVVGARSALFLPLGRLGLIVVDEEHDASYKQSDPAPRYNARDCAVVLAHRLGCRTLLGSATPSLESWLNARSGKYAYAFLGERYGEARPPEILLSDTLRAARRGERHTHFNQLLLDRIGATLARGGQAMLFQNRRGFAPYVACAACGWTPRCPECNVTLTYHKAGGRLVCHYCGHTETLPSECPVCHAAAPAPMGFGTEKIEEQIAELFPAARVARLDRDSVTSERAFREIVADFAEHRTDILVGTQMIAKGFDFEGVELVGVLNADNLLHNPDFRASERAFQLLVQVAGRAGRRAEPGTVVIQTAEPGHPLLQQVVAGDYGAMALGQLAEREAFFYPPYARLIALTLRHRDAALLRDGALRLAARLRARFGRRLLGPMAPPVDRIRGEYLVGLLLKIESGASTARARELLRGELAAFAADPATKSITVVINVDPQ